MGTTIRTSMRNVLPELYLHLRPSCDAEGPRRAFLISDLGRKARLGLRHEFAGPWQLLQERCREPPDSYLFTISLEDGSLKIRVKTMAKTVGVILISYGALRQGLDYFAKDIGAFYNHLAVVVATDVGADRRSGIIRHERRLGAIARLDEVIQKYQAGQIDRERFDSEAASILNRIRHSADGELLIPAVNRYVADVYHLDFPGPRAERPQMRAPSPHAGRPFSTGAHTPVEDREWDQSDAILPEGFRVRRRKEDERRKIPRST